MANPVPVSYHSPVPKIAGGRHSADLVIDHDIDSGNIATTNQLILGHRLSTPSVECKVDGLNRHWLFALDKAKGRIPNFKVAYSSTARRADWAPFVSYDLWNWVKADFVEVPATKNSASFRFGAPFEADRVFVADKPVFTAGHFDQLAASLIGDTSGRIDVSASANPATGAIMTTRAGVNRHGTAIGSNSVYGFVFEDHSKSPVFSARKRELVVTCGVHAGEVEDGWYLKGLIDEVLHGVGDHVDQFWRDWKMVCYFAVNPNGRRAGLIRSSTYNTGEDTNRDWRGPEARTFDETRAVQDAAAIDAPNHDAHFDLHSTPGTILAQCYRRSELPLAPYTVFATSFQAHTGNNLNLGLSTAVDTITDWAYLDKGALFTIVSEPGNANGLQTSTYTLHGAGYIKGLMAVQSSGYFEG